MSGLKISCRQTDNVLYSAAAFGAGDTGMKMVGGRTRLLGLIGHPVGHSLSPRMHNAAFAADRGTNPEGLDYVYVAMDVWPDHLAAAARGLAAVGFVGFNVTMPHKEAVLPLMDELDKTARLAGAVNTV